MTNKECSICGNVESNKMSYMFELENGKLICIKCYKKKSEREKGDIISALKSKNGVYSHNNIHALLSVSDNENTLSCFYTDEVLEPFQKGLKEAFKKYFMELDRKLGEEREAKAHRAGAKANGAEAKAHGVEAKAYGRGAGNVLEGAGFVY